MPNKLNLIDFLILICIIVFLFVVYRGYRLVSQPIIYKNIRKHIDSVQPKLLFTKWLSRDIIFENLDIDDVNQLVNHLDSLFLESFYQSTYLKNEQGKILKIIKITSHQKIRTLTNNHQIHEFHTIVVRVLLNCSTIKDSGGIVTQFFLNYPINSPFSLSFFVGQEASKIKSLRGLVVPVNYYSTPDSFIKTTWGKIELECPAFEETNLQALLQNKTSIIPFYASLDFNDRFSILGIQSVKSHFLKLSYLMKLDFYKKLDTVFYKIYQEDLILKPNISLPVFYKNQRTICTILSIEEK